MRLPLASAWVCAAAAIACGPPLVGTARELTAPQRDDLQRALPRPPVEETAVYVNAKAETSPRKMARRAHH